MDYVVGSVAALISGNVTPNRPKLVRRALTPIKHQPSPNVTPKSEFVEDRSIFLSPTLQKKKAIVKKSPKRIFENPDLDVTSENEGNDSLSSPKANKVKKHLKDELETDLSKTSPKSPKNKKNKSLDMSCNSDNVQGRTTPKKKKNKGMVSDNVDKIQKNETPKKNKSKDEVDEASKIISENQEENVKSPKKSNKRLLIEQNVEETESESLKKKNKKRKHNESNEIENQSGITIDTVKESKKIKKKNKKRNKKQKKLESTEGTQEEGSKKSKGKTQVNPNAITDKDTDSEHESDDEIESENEETNNEILDTGPAQDSSDEEEEETTSKTPEKVERQPASEDEVKRTLFVGNVPFSKKCKKEIKKIFSKHGTIETVRIRTVPVKDPRFTPKLALIKQELHPERSTVNVYVKFREEASVAQALVENNTVLNDHHLRVTRSDSTGAAHDPKCSVFVGNLPFGLEDEAFRAKFESCGEIESVRIIRDKKTNAGKGFGYINFASKDGVELALNMKEEDLTIKNRILRVRRCAANPGPRPQPHGQGGHKGFVRKNDGQGGMKQGGKFQGNQGKFQRNQGKFQGNQGKFQGNQGKFQGNQGKGPGNFRGNDKEEGAYRRIMNKRKDQDGADGPPDKKAKQSSQLQKEKKVRKEFVGMTAEKRKKHTFNKGQKKKKILSEILANK